MWFGLGPGKVKRWSKKTMDPGAGVGDIRSSSSSATPARNSVHGHGQGIFGDSYSGLGNYGEGRRPRCTGQGWR